MGGMHLRSIIFFPEDTQNCNLTKFKMNDLWRGACPSAWPLPSIASFLSCAVVLLLPRASSSTWHSKPGASVAQQQPAVDCAPRRPRGKQG